MLAPSGFQIATKQISEGVKAAVLAAEAGASWIDLNCGCPIYGMCSGVKFDPNLSKKEFDTFLLLQQSSLLYFSAALFPSCATCFEFCI